MVYSEDKQKIQKHESVVHHLQYLSAFSFALLYEKRVVKKNLKLRKVNVSTDYYKANKVAVRTQT